MENCPGAARPVSQQRPKLLDLFCGAGGAARGYQQAGFYVVGVDIKPQPRYCGDEFIQADALEFLDAGGWKGFDAIHASPPCQGYSIMRNLPWHREKEYPMLLDPVRSRLLCTRLPWVMENVMGAKLEAGFLCGLMFGLHAYNHRAFETSFFWLQPGHPRHTLVFHQGNYFGSNGGRRNMVASQFGIDWMTRDERSSALPPAYTRFIGEQLRKALP